MHKIVSALIFILLFLAGCSSHKPDVVNSEHHEPVNYDGKRSLGIFLFASGNEPFWVVDINSGDSTRIYILADNYNVKLNTPVPAFDSVSKTITYSFSNGAVLTLKKAKCTDNMSGEISEFNASLKMSGKTYNGCGKFIIATMNPLLSPATLRLNDIWALRKFKGKTIIPSDFKEGIPVLELHLNDGRFLGNTNCNEISGRMDAGDSYITLYDFTSTKKHCDGDFESLYLQELKSVDSWSLEKMSLILKKKGEEILVYQKVD
jgi:uncharacterized membrane protein/heat shock protein HslJ